MDGSSFEEQEINLSQTPVSATLSTYEAPTSYPLTLSLDNSDQRAPWSPTSDSGHYRSVIGAGHSRSVREPPWDPAGGTQARTIDDNLQFHSPSTASNVTKAYDLGGAAHPSPGFQQPFLDARQYNASIPDSGYGSILSAPGNASHNTKVDANDGHSLAGTFGTDQSGPSTPHSQALTPAGWPSMHGQAPYQITINNTQMPLLVPYPQAPPPPPQRSYTESCADEFINPFQAGGTSQLATELYHSPFFPTIDVIPSRNKRRKVLKTGVKRIAQSLDNAGAARSDFLKTSSPSQSDNAKISVLPPELASHDYSIKPRPSEATGNADGETLRQASQAESPTCRKQSSHLIESHSPTKPASPESARNTNNDDESELLPTATAVPTSTSTTDLGETDYHSSDTNDNPGSRGGQHGGGGGDQQTETLRMAIENASQDRWEFATCEPQFKEHCKEACKNSKAEVLRLAGKESDISGRDPEDDGPGTSKVQNLVRDLQCRVDRLLDRTEARQKRSMISLRKMPQLARRPSLPVVPSPGQSRRTDDDSDAYSTIWTQRSEEHVSPESTVYHRNVRSSLLSSNGLQPSLSEIWTRRDSLSIDSGLSMPMARARSEPLVRRVKLLSDEATSRIRTHVYAQGPGSNSGNGARNNDPPSQKSSQKRKNRDSKDGEEREHDERDEPNIKRRKLFGSELQKCKTRFPCIFHAGEPNRFPKDTTRYEHISHLLRHLRSHDFFACSKCFTKFEDYTSCKAHKQDPCAKSCSRENCRRHVPQGAERSSACECITSSEEQWRELFRLQYPFIAVPAIFEEGAAETVDLEERTQDSLHLFEFTIPDTVGSAFGNLATDSVEPSIEYSNAAFADAVQINGSFLNDLQLLRQRVQLLEQRISQPTERESDLEMVLGNVWQALVRSGSRDAQPESPIWRLVRRFAHNVLSTTSDPILPGQANVDGSGGLTNSTTTFDSADWMNLINDPSISGPSKDIRSDSGYHTGL